MARNVRMRFFFLGNSSPTFHKLQTIVMNALFRVRQVTKNMALLCVQSAHFYALKRNVFFAEINTTEEPRQRKNKTKRVEILTKKKIMKMCAFCVFFSLRLFIRSFYIKQYFRRRSKESIPLYYLSSIPDEFLTF